MQKDTGGCSLANTPRPTNAQLAKNHPILGQKPEVSTKQPMCASLVPQPKPAT